MSEYSVHPETRVGDPFTSFPAPHACNHGWVSIGQIVIDEETGEETEEQSLYLCQICARGVSHKQVDRAQVPNTPGGRA